VWQTLNGTGTNGITTLTGVDAFVLRDVRTLGDNSSWNQGDACPNLQAQYQAIAQYPNVYDGLHHSGTAKTVEAASLVMALTGLGLWTG
jgi:hypothetical protein